MTHEASIQPLTVRIEDDLLIPPDAADFSTFRKWVLSGDFPEEGRIDYLQGTIEVDKSPEELQSHGALKSCLHLFVGQVVAAEKLGQVFVDRARLTSEAGLSSEPDVVFVSWEALREERVRYVATSPSRPGRLLEIEGAADLVIEVVSDGSVGKDNERLPPLYAAAGVRELWLADARGDNLRLDVYHLVDRSYAPAVADAQGFRQSMVLGRSVRLRRDAGPIARTWIFAVEERR